MSKKIKVAIVGCGHRSEVYASYSLKEPEKMSIVAVVDPNDIRLNRIGDKFHVSRENRFHSVEEFLEKKIIADAVINGTMDRIHHETAIPLLKAGYHMLLEKPIALSKKELLDIYHTAKDNHCKVMICHVLRYTPFYRTIKQMIMDGTLGEVFQIITEENVSFHHMATAFVRGKWNSSLTCGSEIMMAKCCHDLDVISWLKSGVAPKYVSSMGGLYLYKKEKAPVGSGMKCLVDCKIESTCQYSARKMYLDSNVWNFYAREYLDRFEDRDTMERLEWSLRENNPMGRCVWQCDNNVMDHQSVMIKYEDGSVATHILSTGTARPSRTIHVIGTKAEIYGDMTEGAIYLRKHDLTVKDKGENLYEEIKIDCNAGGGHGGGDERLSEDFCHFIEGTSTSISSTEIGDSIYGHMIGFDADVAMKENRVVLIDLEMEKV
ncbi:MAG: Gfo/Idh/MocA family oxidoreductase [Clostridia bacterium]|nr:Gfo/Idh/MocA family oxidoreductase [Clostridia bacterium]